MKTLAVALTQFVLVSQLALAAGISGNIYEIRSCDQNGNVLESGKQILTSGDTARFLIRLFKNSSGGSQFSMQYMGLDSPMMAMALHAPQIGISVGGILHYARMENYVMRADQIFTDLIFSYTVEPGDLARPIRLLLNDFTIADQYTSSKPYLVNLNSWRINDGLANAVFAYATPPYTIYPPEGTRKVDADLSGCQFYAETVNFDNWEGSDVWRSIQNGYLNKGPATISLSAPAQGPVTLYAWSDNESVFRVKDGIEHDVFIRPEYTTRVKVAQINIARGSQSATVPLEAMGDGVANLCVSTSLTATGDPVTMQHYEDFVSAPVSSSTVTVDVSASLGSSTVVATSNWKTPVTTLTVELSQPTDEDLTLEIEVEGKTSPNVWGWYDYVRLSESDKGNFSLYEGDYYAYPRVTIPAGQKTAKLYVYALRSDAGSRLNGLDFILRGVETVYEYDGLDARQCTIHIDSNGAEMQIQSSSGTSVNAGQVVPLSIKVSDVYADMQDAMGYLLEYTFDGKNWIQFPEYWLPDDNGVLHEHNSPEKLPSVLILQGGSVSVGIRATSPASGVSSTTAATFQVLAAAQASVSFDRVYCNEGDSEPVCATVSLSMPNNKGRDLYAFLRPLNTSEATPDWKGDFFTITPSSTSSGIKIAPGNATGVGSFRITEGDASAHGTQYAFEVVICSSSVYDASTIVAGYSSTQSSIWVKNKEPEIEIISVNNKDIRDGESCSTVFQKGKEVRVSIVSFLEDSYVDRRSLLTKWRVVYPGGAFDEFVVEGSVEDMLRNDARYTFKSTGEVSIEVHAKDKDMQDWGDKSFVAKCVVGEADVFSDLKDLKSAFGEGSDVVANIKDKAELNKFNQFFRSLGVTAIGSISGDQKKWAYQSFKLSEIMVAPQLFDVEPELTISDFRPSGTGFALTISLTAGGEEIALAKDALRQKIRSGVSPDSVDDPLKDEDIISAPSQDGVSLTFTVKPPSGERGFLKIGID